MATLNTANFFRQGDFSDITIKFGSKEIKAHKIILCSKSQYFQKAIGPNSGFNESQQDFIELKYDDPDAIETILQYLYTAIYKLPEGCCLSAEHPDGLPEWNKHLNVLIAADKYSPQTLKSVAFGELEELYIDLEDLSEIVEFVALGLAYSNAHKRLEALVEDVCDNNICALFNISRFRELMEENKHSRDNLYVRNFDLLRNKAGFRAIVENDGKIALKALDDLQWAHGLHRKDLLVCTKCGAQFTRHEDPNEPEDLRCTNSQCQQSDPPLKVLEQSWVRD